MKAMQETELSDEAQYAIAASNGRRLLGIG
jgi:hypothetical protein